jgi:hypothetical protein
MRVLWMFAQNLHNNRPELLTAAWDSLSPFDIAPATRRFTHRAGSSLTTASPTPRWANASYRPSPAYSAAECIVRELANGSQAAVLSGVAFNTVLKLVPLIGRACSDYQDKVFRNLKCKRVQCDEIWNFCYAKDKNVPEAMTVFTFLCAVFPSLMRTVEPYF